MPSTRSPAHTPEALTTARARITPSSPVSSSRIRAPDEVSSRTPTRGQIRAARGAVRRARSPAGVVGEPAVPGEQAAARPVGRSAGARWRAVSTADSRRGRGQRGPSGARRQPQRVAGLEPGPGQGGLTRETTGVSGSTNGCARTRWGAVRSISTPRSTALSWATSSWAEARER